MKKYLFPALALLLGALGAYARAWQLSSAFEADTGLLIPNAPASRLLLGAAILAVWLSLACALTCRGRRAGCQAAAGADSPALRGLMTLPALGYLLAGLLLLGEQLSQLPAGASTLIALYLPLLLGVVLTISGVGMLLLLRRPSARRRAGSVAMTATLPGFACCLMLVYLYHENASNPVVAAFAWPELAMVAAVLAWYQLARFAFQPERCVLPCWFCLLAMALQLTVLPDEWGVSFRLVLLSNLLWFGLHLWQILDTMTPAEEDGEERKTADS